jgi:hypothetical protein
MSSQFFKAKMARILDVGLAIKMMMMVVVVVVVPVVVVVMMMMMITEFDFG